MLNTLFNISSILSVSWLNGLSSVGIKLKHEAKQTQHYPMGLAQSPMPMALSWDPSRILLIQGCIQLAMTSNSKMLPHIRIPLYQSLHSQLHSPSYLRVADPDLHRNRPHETCQRRRVRWELYLAVLVRTSSTGRILRRLRRERTSQLSNNLWSNKVRKITFQLSNKEAPDRWSLILMNLVRIPTLTRTSPSDTNSPPENHIHFKEDVDYNEHQMYPRVQIQAPQAQLYQQQQYGTNMLYPSPPIMEQVRSTLGAGYNLATVAYFQPEIRDKIDENRSYPQKIAFLFNDYFSVLFQLPFPWNWTTITHNFTRINWWRQRCPLKSDSSSNIKPPQVINSPAPPTPSTLAIAWDRAARSLLHQTSGLTQVSFIISNIKYLIL